ncbi:MAG: hypothetical protein Q8L35_08145 [Actinomycetota bacterium]|nr:hypothetical protein [Actinomycetota bacterium]
MGQPNVGQSSEIIVLITAIGTVVFLFAMDYYFRYQERQAELHLAQAKEESRAPVYIEIAEEGDEPNIAA